MSVAVCWMLPSPLDPPYASVRSELLQFPQNLDCSAEICEAVRRPNKTSLVWFETFRSNGCVWLTPSRRIKKESGFLVALLPSSLPHPFTEQQGVAHEENLSKET